MTEALLYQPNQKWRIGAAFAAATLFHFAAIGLASLHPQERENDISPDDNWSSPFDITTEFFPTDPTPPPEAVESPPSPNPTDMSLFPAETSTPPPVRQHLVKPAVPIVRPGHSKIGPPNVSSTRISALSAPRPEYPYEARRQRITGNGIVAITVDPVTGNVTAVAMEVSTGSPVLDNAAITGFRRWRFKPGTISRVKSPITFTMSGARY